MNREKSTHPLRMLMTVCTLVMAVSLGTGLAQAKKVDTGGTAGRVNTNTLTGGTTAAQPVSVSDPPLSSKSKSVAIDGAKGGSICVGRFTLTVPPGAWYGSGTITLSVPDESKLMCDLTISPASLNGFSVPLTLRTKTTGCNTTDSLLPAYWDPTLATWTHITGGYQDVTSKDTVAPLYHFSRYGTLEAKAGW